MNVYFLYKPALTGQILFFVYTSNRVILHENTIINIKTSTVVQFV